MWITGDSQYAFDLINTRLQDSMNKYGVDDCLELKDVAQHDIANLDLAIAARKLFERAKLCCRLNGKNVTIFNVRREFNTVSDVLANIARARHTAQ